jgi:hypothetical protein
MLFFFNKIENGLVAFHLWKCGLKEASKIAVWGDNTNLFFTILK